MTDFTEFGVVPPVPCVCCGSRPSFIHATADGKRIVYGTLTGVVSRCLPDQLDMKSKVCEFFVGNKTPIQVAAISPDGQVVAGGDNNGTVYIWSKHRDGVTLTEFKLFMTGARISDLSFSDDSKKLSAAAVDRHSKKHAVAINIDNGSAMGKIEGHTLGINSISFRAKKPYLIATAGVDGLVGIHAGPPFKLHRSCEGHHGEVYCVKFSPDGDHLVSCGADGQLLTWDLKNGGVDHEVEVSSASLFSLCWSADSSRVVVVGADRKLRIVEVLSGNVMDEVVRAETAGTPVGVVWTLTDWVCVLCDNGLIWGYKTDQQKAFLAEQHFIWQGPNGGPTAIEVNSLANRIAVGDASGSLLFMCTKDAEPRAFNSLKFPSSTVRSAVLGKTLGAAVTSDGVIRVFRLPKDEVVHSAAKPPPKGAENEKSEDMTTALKPTNTHSIFTRSIGHLADGHTALDSTGTGTLGMTHEVLWIGTHQFKDTPIKAMSINHDHSIVVACSAGILYNYPFSTAGADFALRWSLALHGQVIAASASLDGTLVAIALLAHSDYPLEKFGDGRTSLKPSSHLVEMYEIDSHETAEAFRFVCVYEMHAAEITCIALNPPGTHFASADSARNIYVVEIETGKKLITNEWRYHSGRITCMDWSPDGFKLATGDVDKNIYVWDLEFPSRFIHMKDVHEGGVTCVKFVFNNVLLSTGVDGALVATELTFGEPPAGKTPYKPPTAA